MPQRKPSEIVVGYPRVSDINIPLDSGTLDSQAKAIRHYCDTNRLTLLGMYPEAMTAYMKPFRERPVFMQVMDLARKKQIDAVVVTEYARLSRRQGEQAVIVELLRGYGVKVYSCTENFDDSALGQFMRAAAAFSAESEREKIVYRTTRGMRDRAEAGNITGRGYRTYGYAKADTDKYTNGRFIIVEEEARIVIWIFERAVAGWSFRRIAITLTQMGVPTMHDKPSWNYGTIGAILRNPIYTGSRAKAYRYIRSQQKHSIPRPLDEQISLPEGIVPPIVSEELFDRVQEQIARNKEMSIRNNHFPEIGLMRSLVTCSICGCKMVINHHIDNRQEESIVRSKYNCKKHTGNKKLDHCVTIQTHILDTQVWAEAVRHIKNPHLIRERIATLRSQNKPTVDADAVYGLLDGLRVRYRNLFDLAETATDMDTYNELKARLAGIEREKRELEGMLKDADDEEEKSLEIEREIARFEKWAAEVRPHIENPDAASFADKRSAILVLGLRAVIYPSGGKERFEITVAPPTIMNLLEARGDFVHMPSQRSYSPV